MFHDRPTCARSRSRCSRPERGRSKVPFSWCRCHILVTDYRWGSMGPNEPATATTGGPRVIDVFYGDGAPSGPITHFLWWQIGSWRPLGVGLVVGRRLYRIRRRCGSLVLPESPRSHCQVIHAYLGQHVPELRKYFSLFSQKPELSGWLPGGQLLVLESGVPGQPVLHRAGGSAGVHRVRRRDIGRVQNVSGRVQ